MLDSQRLGELWQHPADPCLAEAHIWAGVPAKPPLSQASLLLLEHPVLVTSPWLHLCFLMLFLGYYGRCSYLCCGAAPALGVEVRGATVEFLRELLEASREKPVWLGSLGGSLFSLWRWLCRKVGHLGLCGMHFFRSPFASE